MYTFDLSYEGRPTNWHFVRSVSRTWLPVLVPVLLACDFHLACRRLSPCVPHVLIFMLFTSPVALADETYTIRPFLPLAGGAWRRVSLWRAEVWFYNCGGVKKRLVLFPLWSLSMVSLFSVFLLLVSYSRATRRIIARTVLLLLFSILSFFGLHGERRALDAARRWDSRQRKTDRFSRCIRTTSRPWGEAADDTLDSTVRLYMAGWLYYVLTTR